MKKKLLKLSSRTNWFWNSSAYSPGKPTGSSTVLTSQDLLNAYSSITEIHMELPHTGIKKPKPTTYRQKTRAWLKQLSITFPSLSLFLSMILVSCQLKQLALALQLWFAPSCCTWEHAHRDCFKREALKPFCVMMTVRVPQQLKYLTLRIPLLLVSA